MSVPPYAVAAVATVLVGYLGDRTHRRGVYAILIAPLGMIGFAVLLSDVPAKGKYAGTFLAALGIYPLIPNTICWVASNTEGVYKRGLTLGIAMGWANLQGLGKAYQAVLIAAQLTVISGVERLPGWGCSTVHTRTCCSSWLPVRFPFRRISLTLRAAAAREQTEVERITGSMGSGEISSADCAAWGQKVRGLRFE